jgi:Spy/CpxP family protein refolding chaperone
MLPLAIGLGLLGFAALRRAHRRCGGYGYHSHAHGWHGGWHGHHGHHHGHGRRRWMLHAGLARLDATPAQERAIVAELDRLEQRVRATREMLPGARGDLAVAMRGPLLDDVTLGAVLGRVDAATGEMRAAGLDALKAIHALLDDKQRATLADLLDQRGSWWRGGGPYR